MSRLLVLGRTGQVGRELVRALAPLGEVVALGRADLDLADLDALRAALRDVRPDVVANAAAYTAVDRAETDEAAAFRLNADVPALLAEEAARTGALLVHYSTDYVFDGTRRTPYRETDPPAPLGVYGRSKRAGEEAVEAAGARAVVLRTSWVYGPHGHNFYRTMRRLAAERAATGEPLRVVDDQTGAPTSSVWLADATAALLPTALREVGEPRLVHAACGGATTWCGFARAIVERHGLGARVEPIPTSAYPTPARRPAYSVLATDVLRSTFGVAPPAWPDALDAVVAADPDGPFPSR